MAPLISALLSAALSLALYASTATTQDIYSSDKSLSGCPGYTASQVQDISDGFMADLSLAGPACNVYGTDVQNLTLTVQYQTSGRLHVIIQDAAQQIYQIPESVLPSPGSSGCASSRNSKLQFHHTSAPFAFWVTRKCGGEVLFDTRGSNFVFEDQYVGLKTSLPDSPSLYGLGEHTDPFMLNTTNYTRTLWNRDAYGVPPGTNLYGDHPIYFDHRGSSGTHGVFLRNSNGMDIKINDTDGQYLEYNILGGVLDFYFLAGPTPVEVAQQYSEVVGKSAMMPYWGFGFHQCRYGMFDVYEVAGVVHNYSVSGIPLETMWTDIDYMNIRQVFTNDVARFPLPLVRELVSYLHDHQQHYIVMVDPAVAYVTEDYPPYTNGVNADAFLKNGNGSIYQGVVWPGVTEFPDWFAPGTQDYWNGEFDSFFSADTGIDIDALWIDMNEASNFCVFPCIHPEQQAIEMGDPPYPPALRLGSPIPLPGFSAAFQPVPCQATVNFEVKATNTSDEYLRVLGSAFAIGEGNIWNSAQMYYDGNMWTASVPMLPNEQFSYEYVRVESDGTFVYESQNRTASSGVCASNKTLSDQITTTSPPMLNTTMNKRDTAEASAVDVKKRQTDASGDMLGLPGRDFINPEYHIMNYAGSISNKTLKTSLEHYGGLHEYDTHNLYGAMMSEASRQAMLSRRPTLRPMVITRSTFAGSGRQVGKWLGDNFATWDDYLISIAGLLEFGALFQVPMVGSDVCGYGGVTNERLCARWATLGAFSPFFRNHQGYGTPPHEFYRYPTVAQAAKNAISIRYKLLDYAYTALHTQSQTGTPIVQPMFFAYPLDHHCNSLQYQYLWGPSILVAPVTTDNSTTAQIYLPDDLFYDYATHELVRGTGSMIEKQVPYTEIQLYYKGGGIIAERSNSANTTTELRKESFTLMIAPGKDGSASGSLYLDDGVSIAQPATSEIFFSYSAKEGTFKMTGTFGYDAGVGIERVVVLGAHRNTGKGEVRLEAPIPLTGAFEMKV